MSQRIALRCPRVAGLAVAVALAGCAAAQAPVASPEPPGPSPAERPARAEARYPKLQPGPFGKGIFAHPHPRDRRRAGGGAIESWYANPYIAGAQLSYAWAELEPAPGDYRWERIESDMEPWAREGKKCWIEIATAEKRDRTGERGTPGWAFERGVPRIGASGTAGYPVFWNETYLALWSKFLHAFAEKFDGDPRIEFVSTGGYSSGHEPNLSSSDNERLMDQWQQAGFDGFTPSGVYLNRAIKPILKTYRDLFRKTPVAQTVHVRTEFDRMLNQHAAGLGFILISNGLSLKIDAETRGAWRERREKLGTKVGYAEWGPTGRETDPEKVRQKKERKRQARQGVRAERSRAPLDRSTAAPLIEAYRAAIGDDGDLRPRSRLSYLPLGERIPEVETEEEWLAALRWAWEHLEP